MDFFIIDRQDENSKELAAYIRHAFESRGWLWNEKDPELVISVGGDGTLLRAIHTFIDNLDRCAFVGIHTGTLGFFTDYTQAEVDVFIQDSLNNVSTIDESPLLEFKTSSSQQGYALNEIRIESLDKTLSLDVYIDEEFFEHSTGSGVCISTQAGSTAINRSLSGAVIDPGLTVLQLCEIMPIAHKNHHSLRSPYIMKSNRVITIKGKSLAFARAAYDYFAMQLDDIDSITIKTSQKKVRFLRFRPYSYLDRLKNLY